MFKCINTGSLKEDLRKIAIACFIGGLSGLFLRPHHELAPLIALFSLGGTLWFLGLRDKRGRKK